MDLLEFPISHGKPVSLSTSHPGYSECATMAVWALSGLVLSNAFYGESR
jgi:hypothetical protein